MSLTSLVVTTSELVSDLSSSLFIKLTCESWGEHFRPCCCCRQTKRPSLTQTFELFCNDGTSWNTHDVFRPFCASNCWWIYTWKQTLWWTQTAPPPAVRPEKLRTVVSWVRVLQCYITELHRFIQTWCRRFRPLTKHQYSMSWLWQNSACFSFHLLSICSISRQLSVWPREHDLTW